MTYRTIHGLTFKVFSPALYELCARDDGSFISVVTIALVGRQWYIDVLLKNGDTHHRGPFRSRDAAVAVLLGKRESVA